MICKSVSSGSAIVFWTARKMLRSVAEHAFAAEGLEKALPAVDYHAALRRAAMSAAESAGLKQDSRLRHYNLPGNPNGVGCEVRRIVPGALRNEMPFLFSVAVFKEDDGSLRVRIIDTASTPDMDEFRKHFVRIEQQIHDAWEQECMYVSANDLTNAITSLVKSRKGFLLRDEGVVWYLSEDEMGAYERIADLLSPHGVSMQAVRFSPDVNSTLLEHVRDELQRRQAAVFSGQIEALADMEQRGAKTRSNGQRSRVEEWSRAHETLMHHRDLLGDAFKPLVKAAKHAREKIGEAAFAEFV